MKAFIATLAVTVLAIGSASAGKPGHNSGSHPSYNGNYHTSSFYSSSHHMDNYHLKYGKKFSGGWYFPGNHHNFWNYKCYWPKYGCECYWCPSTCCYYYWYAPAGCYYPISYITRAAPGFASAPGSYGPPPEGIPGLPG